MNILIIGSSGQLALSSREVAPDNLTISFIGRPNIDLAKPNNLQDIFTQKRPDIVVNAAAYTAVDKAQDEAELAFAINANGVEQLALLCEQHSIPIIHISTDYVFDGTNAKPYTEIDPVAPLGVYGKSKLRGEELLAASCSRHIILRTSWVYSPFGNNFLKTMLRLATSKDEISVVSDQIGNPTYAPHLAKAIFDIIPQIANKDITCDKWGIYHCSGSGEASWYEFALEIFNQSAKYGYKKPLVHAISSDQYPTPVTRPANSRLDCKKIEKIFNVKLPHWHEGTRECIKILLGENK